MNHRNLWFAKEHALGLQSGCKLASCQSSKKAPNSKLLHAPTRNTKSYLDYVCC